MWLPGREIQECRQCLAVIAPDGKWPQEGIRKSKRAPAVTPEPVADYWRRRI